MSFQIEFVLNIDLSLIFPLIVIFGQRVTLTLIKYYSIYT